MSLPSFRNLIACWVAVLAVAAVAPAAAQQQPSIPESTGQFGIPIQVPARPQPPPQPQQQERVVEKREEAVRVAVPVIIVVDPNQILQEAKAAKGIQAQIEQQRAAYSKDISQQEDELQKTRADLERQRGILAPEVFDSKTKEYQQKVDALDKNVREKRAALQNSWNEARGKVESAMLTIIADIAKERRATLVFAKAALVFAAENYDITGEALQRLDRKLPSVAVNLPKDDNQPPTAENTAATTPVVAAPGKGKAKKN